MNDQPQHKTYGYTWFTTGRGELLCLVAMNNGYEDKAYIGVCRGVDEEEDVKHTLDHGAKFPFKQAMEVIGVRK